MQECIQLYDGFYGRQPSDFWESTGKQTRTPMDLTCMMAVIIAADKKKVETTSASSKRIEQEPINKEGSCQQACDRDGCQCEGFNNCIGRQGHQRRPHQCHAESGSTSHPVARGLRPVLVQRIRILKLMLCRLRSPLKKFLVR